MSHEPTFPYFALGLTVLLVVVWRLCVKVGPDWLKPGHGPLWYISAAVTMAVGAVIAGSPSTSGVRRAWNWLASPVTLNGYIRALLLLVLLFVVCRLVFGLRKDKASLPAGFVWCGVRRDGSPFVEFRHMWQWVLIASISALLLSAFAMDRTAPAEHVLWSFMLAALLGCHFGNTHPTNSARGLAAVDIVLLGAGDCGDGHEQSCQQSAGEHHG